MLALHGTISTAGLAACLVVNGAVPFGESNKTTSEGVRSGFGYLIIYLSSPLVIYLVSYSVINSGLAKAQFPKAFK